MHKFLTPQVAHLGRPDVPPETDAVDPSFSEGTPESLKVELIDLLGDTQVLSRVIDLVRFASDASPYRYIPQVIVRPKSIEDMQKIFLYCTTHKRHATFRGGGTSLCGQSQSDDILIDVRHDWNEWQVLDGGQRFKARTGTLLGHANEALAAYQMRLGPDPASAHAATLGGVLSNNAGGMRCSLPRDSYHTVESMTVVLPSGTVVDTAAPGAEEEFKKKEPSLAKGLMDLRNELLADPEFVERIKRRYSHRNTNGYGIRSFLDGETPLGILRRVMIGSEGTLGFVAEVVYKTIPLPRLTTVAWLLDSIEWCAGLLPNLAITHKIDHIIIHPTCSTTHLGLNDTLTKLAAEMAKHAEVPIGTTCCGTAGDRGLLHPELVHSAMRDAVVQINLHPAQRYISANRTCEVGMRQATGKPYESFAFTLEELTRPKV